MKSAIRVALALAGVILIRESASTQDAKKEAAFKWINAFPNDKYPGLRHDTFRSDSNNVDVGYCIYLPPGYGDAENKDRRYPVVYGHFDHAADRQRHDGREGATGDLRVPERRRRQPLRLPEAEIARRDGVHQGTDSAYRQDLPDHRCQGRPGHRGILARRRGTARYMFKYPELFCSAAPMGGGHQHEKRISENNGDEGEYQFEPKNNTYDLAKKFAAESKAPLRVLVVVGDKDMNYQANLDWMEHLRSLKIPFEQRIVKGAPHSAATIYNRAGIEVMMFHAENFKKAAK